MLKMHDSIGIVSVKVVHRNIREDKIDELLDGIVSGSVVRIISKPKISYDENNKNTLSYIAELGPHIGCYPSDVKSAITRVCSRVGTTAVPELIYETYSRKKFSLYETSSRYSKAA
jgi:hypothetical protein